MKKSRNTGSIVVTIVLGIAALMLGIAFVFWTVIPHWQMRRYDRALRSPGAVDALVHQESLYRPYTYVQLELRNSALDNVLAAYGKEKTDAESLRKAVRRLQEAVSRQGSYIKPFHTLARAYTVLARRTPSQQDVYLGLAEYYARKAYDLIPTNPEVAHVYSLALANQGRYQEAIDVLTRSLQLAPVPETRFNLGVTYYRMGTGQYREALDQLEASELRGNQNSALGIYRDFLRYFSAVGDTYRLEMVRSRLRVLDPETRYP